MRQVVFIMADTKSSSAQLPGVQPDRMFPRLTPEQVARYLSSRIEDNPAIVVRRHTEIIELEGGNHLERVRWRDNKSGEIETHDIRHIFLMLGDIPNKQWLNGCVVLDENG